jgi:hypothetical protein
MVSNRQYDTYKTMDNEDGHDVHLRAMTCIGGFILVIVNYGESFLNIRQPEERRSIYYVLTLVNK